MARFSTALRHALPLTLTGLTTTLLFAACGSSGEDTAGGSGGSVNFGGSTSGGNSGSNGDASASGGSAGSSNGGTFNIDASSTDGSLNQDSACESQSAEATLVKKPVDIIFVIDNSGSMSGEITAVQNNINVNFAQIIGDSGIDYRVIMLAKHGTNSSQSVCIEAPLSGIPTGGCATPPSQPVNTANFFHYSEEIASTNSLCKILETFNQADDLGFAPNGWAEWLRPDSFKMFVEITDDDVSCSFNGQNFNDGNTVMGGETVGMNFDIALRTMSPENFGAVDGERNYRWYSIVGMGANTPATAPWPHTDPINTSQCSPGSAGRGTGYQQLSIMTESLRYPSCENASFDSIFLAIAEGVISGTKVACEFEIPPPPDGETIDLETVQVRYTPGGGGTDQIFNQVANEAACVPGAFYILNNSVFLCPDTCTTVQADDSASVGILFGCEPKVPD